MKWCVEEMTDGGSKRNERYDYIDYAKAVAIFLIGIGHFLPNGSFARVALYSFHVPVFFFITYPRHMSGSIHRHLLMPKIRNAYRSFLSMRTVEMMHAIPRIAVAATRPLTAMLNSWNETTHKKYTGRNQSTEFQSMLPRMKNRFSVTAFRTPRAPFCKKTTDNDREKSRRYGSKILRTLLRNHILRLVLGSWRRI